MMLVLKCSCLKNACSRRLSILGDLYFSRYTDTRIYAIEKRFKLWRRTLGSDKMTILAKVTFTKGLIKIPLGQVVKNVEIGRVEVRIKSQFYKNSKIFAKMK